MDESTLLYVVAAENGIKHTSRGVEVVLSSGAATYSGSLEDNVRHGEGVLTCDGCVLAGTFANGVLDGAGAEVTYASGARYAGAIHRGVRHGKGEMKSRSTDGGDSAPSAAYAGGWIDGKRDGFGCQTFDDGSYYEGGWQNDARHGPGRMRYPSGAEFVGTWVVGRKDGVGVMAWPAPLRAEYAGGWCDDAPVGAGVHVWFSSDGGTLARHHGAWGADGARAGVGVVELASGARLVASFDRGVKHGPAVFVADDGAVWGGVFCGDALNASPAAPHATDAHAPPAAWPLRPFDPAGPVDAAALRGVRPRWRTTLQQWFECAARLAPRGPVPALPAAGAANAVSDAAATARAAYLALVERAPPSMDDAPMPTLAQVGALLRLLGRPMPLSTVGDELLDVRLRTAASVVAAAARLLEAVRGAGADDAAGDASPAAAITRCGEDAIAALVVAELRGLARSRDRAYDAGAHVRFAEFEALLVRIACVTEGGVDAEVGAVPAGDAAVPAASNEPTAGSSGGGATTTTVTAEPAVATAARCRTLLVGVRKTPATVASWDVVVDTAAADVDVASWGAVTAPLPPTPVASRVEGAWRAARRAWATAEQRRRAAGLASDSAPERSQQERVDAAVPAEAAADAPDAPDSARARASAATRATAWLCSPADTAETCGALLAALPAASAVLAQLPPAVRGAVTAAPAYDSDDVCARPTRHACVALSAVAERVVAAAAAADGVGDAAAEVGALAAAAGAAATDEPAVAELVGALAALLASLPQVRAGDVLDAWRDGGGEATVDAGAVRLTAHDLGPLLRRVCARGAVVRMARARAAEALLADVGYAVDGAVGAIEEAAEVAAAAAAAAAAEADAARRKRDVSAARKAAPAGKPRAAGASATVDADPAPPPAWQVRRDAALSAARAAGAAAAATLQRAAAVFEGCTILDHMSP